jgi:hypothetical protein
MVVPVNDRIPLGVPAAVVPVTVAVTVTGVAEPTGMVTVGTETVGVNGVTETVAKPDSVPPQVSA